MYKKQSLGKYIYIYSIYFNDMRDRCIMKYHAKYSIYLWKFYKRGKEYFHISLSFENTNILLIINIDYIVYIYKYLILLFLAVPIAYTTISKYIYKCILSTKLNICDE